MSTTQSKPASVEVTSKDLPLACPMPGSPAWSSHPRVFVDVTRTGEATCPYCGTHFVLQGGPLKGGHH